AGLLEGRDAGDHEGRQRDHTEGRRCDEVREDRGDDERDDLGAAVAQRQPGRTANELPVEVAHPRGARPASSSRYEASCRPWASQVNRPSTRRRASAPSVAAVRSGSRHSSTNAGASAAASPGGTSRPVTPSMTISGEPPWFVATTGRPNPIASGTVRENGSGPVDGIVYTSA